MTPVFRDNGMTDLELSILDRQFDRTRREAAETCDILLFTGGSLYMAIFKIKEEVYSCAAS